MRQEIRGQAEMFGRVLSGETIAYFVTDVENETFLGQILRTRATRDFNDDVLFRFSNSTAHSSDYNARNFRVGGQIQALATRFYVVAALAPADARLRYKVETDWNTSEVRTSGGPIFYHIPPEAYSVTNGVAAARFNASEAVWGWLASPTLAGNGTRRYDIEGPTMRWSYESSPNGPFFEEAVSHRLSRGLVFFGPAGTYNITVQTPGGEPPYVIAIPAPSANARLIG